jgi:internalin A
MNRNQVEDLSPFSGLTSLKILLLSNNRIGNIGALTDLVSLNTLYLSSNQIEDITALSKLTSLTYLSLFGNRVTEVTVLIDNPGISTFDTVVLTGNPLSEFAVTVQIPALEARRVNVIVTPTTDI